MIHLDTSAFLRTVFDESESPALRAFLGEMDTTTRRDPPATALLLRDESDVLISDDRRMLTAAAAHGLPPASPA